MMPTPTLVLVCALVGLLVGSFLNVVVWRVPRGESVVTPPSACPACGHTVRPRDNVPLVSWLLLRGRCRDCRAPISVRYPLVEAATALIFALTSWWSGASFALPAYLYLAAVALALALIDVDTHRLPDAIVLPSYLVAGVLLVGASLLDHDLASAVRALIGMVALYALYFLLAIAWPGGMGFGDVKLAGLLGLYLAWHSWSALAVGSFAAFFLGGVVAVALVAVGAAGRRSRLAFGPFMLLGACTGLVAGNGLVAAYLGAVGL